MNGFQQDEKILGFGMIEVDRSCAGPGNGGSVAVVLVSPDRRRRGLGGAILAGLEDRLCDLGVTEAYVGGNFHSFWSAIPQDRPGAIEFFAASGYKLGAEAFDLVIPLTGWQSSNNVCPVSRDLGIEIEPLTPELVGNALAFEQREFPDWFSGLLKMLSADMGNVIVVRRGIEVLGSVCTFTPNSRWYTGGMQREAQIGGQLGAIGAVGIAKSWRGKGLGRAMCAAALLHIQSQGGTHCYIDQVEPHIVPFYEQMGAKVYAHYRYGTKLLQP